MTNKEKQVDNSPLSVKDAFNRLVNDDENYLGNAVTVTKEEVTSKNFSISHLLLLARTDEG